MGIEKSLRETNKGIKKEHEKTRDEIKKIDSRSDILASLKKVSKKISEIPTSHPQFPKLESYKKELQTIIEKLGNEDVVKAVESLQSSIAQIKPVEIKETEIDTNPIIEQLKLLLDKIEPIKLPPFKFTDSGRLMVAEIGGGGTRNVNTVDSAGQDVNVATEEKQDALITELEKKADLTETQPVSDSDLTSGDQKTQITSPSGNTAEVNSDNQLHVVMEGKVDDGNSTATPLSANATFTGTSIETLAYALIVISIYSDQESATDGLCIEFSTDNTNWFDAECYTISAGDQKIFTYQPEARYYRIKYTNGGTDQTAFRLQSTLKKTYSKPSSHRIADNISSQDDAELVKAVLTGQKPSDGDFVNFQATTNGNFKMSLEELENDISVNSNTQLKTTLFDSSGDEVSVNDNALAVQILDKDTGNRRTVVAPNSALKVVETTRLVGTAFDNGTKDTNFWTETVTGSGSVTQSGGITLSTGTTADSTTQYDSIRKARYVQTAPHEFRSIASFTTEGTANNLRRIGAYDDDNGLFFQLNGTTFSVGYRRGGSDTLVNSGSFNGAVSEYAIDTNPHRMFIQWNLSKAFFFIDSELIHTVTFTPATCPETRTFPIRIENNNSGGSTSDVDFCAVGMTIIRFGKIETEAAHKFINTNTTTICKYGAGRLKRILNVDNAGNITIYDNTSATGTVIATIDTAKALGTLDFDIPFSNGLTVVTATSAKVVVIYE